MNINRDNYEMYFLLYVDKELSAEERNAVEKFVAENADLKAELESLVSATLPVEKIGFEAKSLLYKNEVANDELKEKMLLHLDNELDATEVASLESAMSADSSLKREWNILQQAKLDPTEKIVFEQKALLYRHQRNNVISIQSWRRIAAAAAVIGIGLFVGITFFTKDQQSQSVAVTNKNEQPAQKATIPGKINNTVEENNASDNDQLAENTNNGDEQMLNNTVTGNESQQQSSTSERLASNSTNSKNISPATDKTPGQQQKTPGNNTIVKKETNNLPKPYFENINNQNSNITASSNVQDNMKGFTDKKDPVNTEKVIVAKNDGDEIKRFDDIPLTETPNSYAKTAALDESASETSNSNILFMNADKVNRSKVGGFFKKAKRMVERNVNIKAGNGLKIAGFEIAAK